jgi:hypothetical protein
MAFDLAPSGFCEKRLKAVPLLDRGIPLAAVAAETGRDDVVDLI